MRLHNVSDMKYLHIALSHPQNDHLPLKKWLHVQIVIPGWDT